MIGQFALQAFGMLGQLALGGGAFQQQAQGLGLKRFVEEPESVQIVDHVDGGFQAPVRGEHDGLRPLGAPLELFEELFAVHIGHVEVSDHDVGGKPVQFLQGFLAVGGGFHRVAPQLDHAGQRAALALLVIHY